MRLCDLKRVCAWVERKESTEQFIDRRVALYKEETRIRVVTNKGDQQVGNSWLEDQVYLTQKCYHGLEGVGRKDQVQTSLEMSLMGMW